MSQVVKKGSNVEVKYFFFIEWYIFDVCSLLSKLKTPEKSFIILMLPCGHSVQLSPLIMNPTDSRQHSPNCLSGDRYIRPKPDIYLVIWFSINSVLRIRSNGPARLSLNWQIIARQQKFGRTARKFCVRHLLTISDVN